MDCDCLAGSDWPVTRTAQALALSLILGGCAVKGGKQTVVYCVGACIIAQAKESSAEPMIPKVINEPE